MKSFAVPILVALTGLASAAWAGDTPSADFAATFVQTRTLPGFEQALVSHGLLRVSEAEGFYWEINKPYHYVFTMHGDRAREELPDGTVRHLTPEQTPWLKMVQRIFVNALSGHRERLKRWFEITVEPLDDGRHVTLMPSADTMAQVITRIEVTESADGRPRYLVIDEASGARMTIRFTPVEAGAGAP